MIRPRNNPNNIAQKMKLNDHILSKSGMSAKNLSCIFKFRVEGLVCRDADSSRLNKNTPIYRVSEFSESTYSLHMS